jgi:hypothetical protein
MKCTLQDSYEIIFYRIWSYESNSLREKTIIGSQSYTNVLEFYESKKLQKVFSMEDNTANEFIDLIKHVAS